MQPVDNFPVKIRVVRGALQFTTTTTPRKMSVSVWWWCVFVYKHHTTTPHITLHYGLSAK